MRELELTGTQSTPNVKGDWVAGTLHMSGDSYPENSFEMFGDIIEWVEDYLQQTDGPLHMDLRLIYMNTSSVRAMLDIFDMLEEAHNRGRQVSVDWYYDPRNERVVSLADEFKEDCTFPFHILAQEVA
ncbi:MAG: biofilm regulation phosphoprotein SiaC [Pseudomonadota bacterium]